VTRTTDRLVLMANQIAVGFRPAHPDKASAQACEHIELFWDPRMRRLIVEHLEAGGRGLTDVARAAIARLAERRRET
jgi:formate dehydrogenase subunit delta